MKAEIIRLAQTVEALGMADPAIDHIIARLVGPTCQRLDYSIADDPYFLMMPATARYTGSLDDALTLVPDDCRLGRLSQRPDGEAQWDCILEKLIGSAGSSFVVRSFGGASAALSVTAAALRLHAAMMEEQISAAA